MERLSDIVDQPSEFQSSSDVVNQIALPPINGDVSFKDISFSFKKDATNLQLNNVSLDVQAGSLLVLLARVAVEKVLL